MLYVCRAEERAEKEKSIVSAQLAEDDAVVRSCGLPPPHNEILGQPVQAGVYLSLGTQISL